MRRPYYAKTQFLMEACTMRAFRRQRVTFIVKGGLPVMPLRDRPGVTYAQLKEEGLSTVILWRLVEVPLG